MQSSVDSFDAGGFLGFHNQVNEGDVRGWYAYRQAVELAFQLRQNQGNSLGSAGGCRDHRQGCSTGATHVAMGQVEDALVVGVSVNCGHQAFNDTETIHDDLGDRSQAVGGAGGVRDDVVLSGIVQVVVNAHADS